MDIYISNLTDICNKTDLLKKLTPDQLARYHCFTRDRRADQFLCAHSIANDLAGRFQYISISHKDNWVIVAGANVPVGVDIENTAIKRNFTALGAFLGAGGTSVADEFYRAFTAAEARYKMQPAIPTVTRFYKLGDYMICLATVGDDLLRFIGATPEQIQ